MNSIIRVPRSLAMLLSFLMALAVSLIAQQPVPSNPSIISALANFQNNQLTITGSSFGSTTPTVSLDGQAIKFIPRRTR